MNPSQATVDSGMPDTIEDTRLYLEGQLALMRDAARGIANVVKTNILHSARILNTLTSVMEEGMILVDKDDKITIFNPAASAIFDVNPSEAIGRDIKAVIGESAAQVRSTELGDDVDGLRLLVASRASCADVSDQLRRELEVRDQIMWTYPLPTIYCDLSGNSVRASREFCNQVGISLETLHNSNIRDVIPEQHHDWLFEIIDSSSDLMLLEGRAVTAKKSLVRDRQGVPVGFIVCFTKQHFEQHQIELAASVVQGIDSINNPMILTTFRDGRILLANRAYCASYRYEKAALVNSDISHLYQTTPERHRAFLKELLRQGRATAVIRAIDASGSQRLTSIHGQTVHAVSEGRRIPKYCLISES